MARDRRLAVGLGINGDDVIRQITAPLNLCGPRHPELTHEQRVAAACGLVAMQGADVAAEVGLGLARL